MYQYRGYVKDALDLAQTPKAFLTVTSFTIRRDLLASATSSFEVLTVPSNVNTSDILCLYDPYGTVMYQGVINQIEDTQIQCLQITSIYKGTWLCENDPQDYLEHEVANIITKYASGYITETVTDTLMKDKLGTISVSYEGTNTNNLPTYDDQTTEDMESFIYSLYDTYGIVLEFDIPFSGSPSVVIKTANYSSYKIANNTQAIFDISPLTEVSETNKLIVFDSEGVYRAVYYATPEGITTDPDDPLRLSSINTTIQFTDDDLDTVVAAQLPDQMYDHKLTFSMYLDNKLYDWWQWHLGQPLDIYFNSVYYKSVYTAYEMTKDENSDPVQVDITCGKVRTSLTKRISMGNI